MNIEIEGVLIKPLKWCVDERGRLMEILRNDDEIFKGFGQVYVTTCKPGYAKAWHFHRHQEDNFVCLAGRMRV
ncbi:MAG: dTDP-4-dehydrorhamnose 3,5-epimerase, partial [Kiritimatiellae bacterium]|nr:dTDP-4-dehydrorhamnose 3,5-epimerase [Kiritimatiellia bacterium]